MGRSASDCRDRWRNHLEGQEVRRSGHWTKEEEEELTKIVTELTVLQGKDIDSDIFWGAVSQRMGGRRGRQQCRIKWYVVMTYAALTLLLIDSLGRIHCALK